MHSQEIRKKFIEYFKKQGHTHLPSSPVIPQDDPTLLFVNAGMNQFKDIFLGKRNANWPTAVTSQKCIRVGGKHNDLENVGHTSRHLTFFEMLGNFSFGDYFKEKAIDMAYDVAKNLLGLDLNHLWATVLYNDEESFALWRRYLPEERICRMGEKDNFWSMGDTGPCGPCSELLYDRGSAFSDARSPAEDIKGERFFEFWNLVFMQFNRDKSGALLTLPKKCVDTGAGLERLVLLKMGVTTLFETDVLGGLIQEIEKLSGVKYNPKDSKQAPAFHVIADHLRALAFAIADGVEPSNLDRGYVLRKVLRRACRYGKILGFEKPFLRELIPCLITLMGESYPELLAAKGRIEEILLREEESFLRTLKRGGGLLNQVMDRAKASQGHSISGDDAFKLKDTYGLPLEEIILLAKDAELTVDMQRFEELERDAKMRSKSAHKQESQIMESSTIKNSAPSTFLGYEHLTSEAIVTGLFKEGKEVSALYEGEEGDILLDQTPFYAEKGGQVGDIGTLSSPKMQFSVLDCKSPREDLILHKGVVSQGGIEIGDLIEASVDHDRRIKIQNNHTATHLLNWALQKTLGSHVKQAGSVVEPTRLRFDFRHHNGLTYDEITQIEDLVNRQIVNNQAITTYEMEYDLVKERQEIQQMFGEKYGDKVRVVDIDFSKELCGGTHTKFTGTIGQFRIVKESSIAGGVRRIEAITGEDALLWERQTEESLKRIALLLKAQPTKIEEKLLQLIDEQKAMEAELKGIKKEKLKEQALLLISQIEKNGPLRSIISEVTYTPKELSDLILQKEEPLVLFLIKKEENNCSLFVRVSKEYVALGVKAHDLLTKAAPLLETKGGGKEEMAQGSSIHVEKIPEALTQIKRWIQEAGLKNS